MKVTFICHFASEYGGNILCSLRALEERLQKEKGSCEYIFPNEAKSKPWCVDLQKSGCRVTFAEFNFKGMMLLGKKLRNTTTLIHTHFVENQNLLGLWLGLGGVCSDSISWTYAV